jgi:hypothetical protein
MPRPYSRGNSKLFALSTCPCGAPRVIAGQNGGSPRSFHPPDDSDDDSSDPKCPSPAAGKHRWAAVQQVWFEADSSETLLEITQECNCPALANFQDRFCSMLESDNREWQTEAAFTALAARERCSDVG